MQICCDLCGRCHRLFSKVGLYLVWPGFLPSQHSQIHPLDPQYYPSAIHGRLFLSWCLSLNLSFPVLHTHIQLVFITWVIKHRFLLLVMAQLHWSIWRCCWWMEENLSITSSQEILPASFGWRDFFFVLSCLTKKRWLSKWKWQRWLLFLRELNCFGVCGELMTLFSTSMIESVNSFVIITWLWSLSAGNKNRSQNTILIANISW